jgi:hypothetical protein
MLPFMGVPCRLARSQARSAHYRRHARACQTGPDALRTRGRSITNAPASIASRRRAAVRIIPVQRAGPFPRRAVPHRLPVVVGQFGRIEHVREHGGKFRRIPRQARAFTVVDVMADFAVLLGRQRQSTEGGRGFGGSHGVLASHGGAGAAPVDLRIYAVFRAPGARERSLWKFANHPLKYSGYTPIGV